MSHETKSMRFNPYRPIVRALNGREHSKVTVESVEQKLHATGLTAASVATANKVKHQQQLEALHESIRELGRLALPHVGSPNDITSAVEILRPLPQDRLYSEKLRRLNTGQGFTRSEYMLGHQSMGAETRRFHTVQGEGFDDVRGIAIPYVFAPIKPIAKRPVLRHNDRPEDLAIALDDSGRSWSGVFVPFDIKRGTRSQYLTRFGVVEDLKSASTIDNALELYKPVVHDSRAIIDRTHFLTGVEDRVIALQESIAPAGHLSHGHTPRP